MGLVPIQNDLFVNTDHISSVQRKTSGSVVKIEVTMVNGRSYIMKDNLDAFTEELMKSGVDLPRQFVSL